MGSRRVGHDLANEQLYSLLRVRQTASGHLLSSTGSFSGLRDDLHERDGAGGGKEAEEGGGTHTQGFSGGSGPKNPPAKQKIWVQSLGREDPLEKGLATHSSILAWKIPWMEEPGGLQSTGPQRVGHDRATKLQ